MCFREKLEGEAEFEVVGDLSDLKAKAAESAEENNGNGAPSTGEKRNYNSWMTMAPRCVRKLRGLLICTSMIFNSPKTLVAPVCNDLHNKNHNHRTALFNKIIN